MKRSRSPSPTLSSSLSPAPSSDASQGATDDLPALPTSKSGIPVSQSNSIQLRSKKLKLMETYSSSSPFPTFPHPTALECTEVYDILVQAHGATSSVPSLPTTSSNSAKTCGSSRNIVDSLIGTILSQNTSGKNSTAAKSSLDDTFGKNNFSAIADAPAADVIEAIRHGGLANKKAATIQSLLRSIKAKHGSYSLQHLTSASLTDEDIMKELISYDGVGPKTASCVLLFCIGRQSFAVDTHVFRLSKALGWLPASIGNDRVKAQAHLDRMVPAKLKYGLHVLLVKHGRLCKGCKVGGKGECILKAHSRGTSRNKSV